MRLCSISWTTNGEKPGSNHTCALEWHHLGPCECGGECNEVCFHLVAELPPPDALPIDDILEVAA